MQIPRLKFGRIELGDYFKMGVTTYRGKLLVQASFWMGGIATGVAAYFFAVWVGWLQDDYTRIFGLHPYLMSLFTPIAFLGAVAFPRFFAPYAGGSGVPQALYATMQAKEHYDEVKNSGLISVWTSVIKVVSASLGFVGGASIGAEGPTVQISASLFGAAGSAIKKRFPSIDFQAYLVAAAGAGIAAAFNTPLGGLTFALEEFTSGAFEHLRSNILLAVIIAGITVEAWVGDSLYFGTPHIGAYNNTFIIWGILIGIIGGICGGIFGRLATWRIFEKTKVNWWLRALICGVIVSLVDYFFSGNTAGSGYEVTKAILATNATGLPLSFPLAKLFATGVSTLSGMGGGILSPSLSIGAWIGVSAGKLATLSNLKVCALLGMVAFFTGAFQVPFTAIIIVMEMTGEHAVIFPMMISALVAFSVARMIMPRSPYHVIIENTFAPSNHAKAS